MQKALFLDRDGVINIDHGYVYKIEDFEFTEGIFELLRFFIEKGYLLFIVTNQSGIGRDYYSEEDFQVLTSWMLDEFKKENIDIISVHHCNHSPEKNCACRKPQTGMIDKILSQNVIDLGSSWLIGDKQSDIDLAKNSKIKNTIAIGERTIENTSLSFKTILECRDYFDDNKIKIL
ncbi:MAG TPA: HAD family hydrolase [Arcobacter sp.]|nr:HAD family hydrolase [Arcobacter sp.]